MRKEDLPLVWADHGMPSGYAYGKSFRTVKTCVGNDFCRFGLGDSTVLVVAIEAGQWQIYVGGAAGAHDRRGDLLTTVDTPEKVITLTGRFLQYYRENANWLERTYAFVPRVGIDAHMQKSVDSYRDP